MASFHFDDSSVENESKLLLLEPGKILAATIVAIKFVYVAAPVSTAQMLSDLNQCFDQK